MKYGIFLEMLGHNDDFSLQKSRQHDSIIDRAASLCLKENISSYREGKFLEMVRNDEKVFNGPGINIPTISLSRARFLSHNEWPYPEYHSSAADTPDIISTEKLQEAEDLVSHILLTLDQNYIPHAKFKGPIFLTRYNLWVDWKVNQELSKNQEDVFHCLHQITKIKFDELRVFLINVLFPPVHIAR